MVFSPRGARAKAGAAGARRLGKPELGTMIADKYGDYINNRSMPEPYTLWDLATDLRQGDVAPWAAGPVVLYAASALEELVAVFSHAFRFGGPHFHDGIDNLKAATTSLRDIRPLDDSPLARMEREFASLHEERMKRSVLGDFVWAMKSLSTASQPIPGEFDERMAHNKPLHEEAKGIWILSDHETARLEEAWARLWRSDELEVYRQGHPGLVEAYAIAQSGAPVLFRRDLVINAMLREQPQSGEFGGRSFRPR